MVQTWANAREDPNEQKELPGLFDTYIIKFEEMPRRGFVECTPIYLLNKVGQSYVGS